MTNQHVAQRLWRYAHDLSERNSNLYRIRACRRAAESVLRLEAPVEKLVVERGREGLEELPGIGRSLAETITYFVETGEWLPDSEEPVHSSSPHREGTNRGTARCFGVNFSDPGRFSW